MLEFDKLLLYRCISSRTMKRSLSSLRTAEYTHVAAEKPPSEPVGSARTGCGAGVTLHLVDIDNLLGDPRTIDRAAIQAVFEQYRAVARLPPGRSRHRRNRLQRDARAGSRTGLAGCPAPPQARAGWRRPGACAEAECAVANGAYDRVVIASGDREFMVAFQNLLAAGFEVEVVANHRRLAAGLAALAHGRLRYFGTPPAPVDPVRPAA